MPLKVLFLAAFALFASAEVALASPGVPINGRKWIDGSSSTGGGAQISKIFASSGKSSIGLSPLVHYSKKAPRWRGKLVAKR